MRFLIYPLLLALIAFGLWPYYSVFQLDEAINREDTADLAPLVDLPAIRAHYKARLAAGLDRTMPPSDPSGVLGWLRQNLEPLGDAALDQAITLRWVRESLREAVTRATDQHPPYLIGAIDYAFFESFDRFLIRVGPLGANPTHIRLQLQGRTWKVTDIIH